MCIYLFVYSIQAHLSPIDCCSYRLSIAAAIGWSWTRGRLKVVSSFEPLEMSAAQTFATHDNEPYFFFYFCVLKQLKLNNKYSHIIT